MKLKLILLVVLVAIGLAGKTHAQSSLAPLIVFTNGDGSISPLQDGQLLVVGQNYSMTAIPDSGYEFSSWQLVNIYTIISTIIDTTGGRDSTNLSSSTITLLGSVYTNQPTLEFTLQPATTLESMYATNSDGTLATNSVVNLSLGWQANFTPVPEPAAVKLVACGLSAILFWHWRSCHRRNLMISLYDRLHLP